MTGREPLRVHAGRADSCAGSGGRAFPSLRSVGLAGFLVVRGWVCVRPIADSCVVEDDASYAALTTDGLVCIECADESCGARGWRAFLLEGELLVYCPGCAASEFDDD
jgi:hypothetical protein